MFNVQDKILVCNDCGQEFTFTAGEQEFFAQKGFSQPNRCKLCRAARKANRSSSDSYGNGDGYADTRQMYPAVCAACGKDTEVPFQPRNDRPVYCSDCFAKQGAGNRNRGGGRGGYSRW